MGVELTAIFAASAALLVGLGLRFKPFFKTSFQGYLF
ncbi:MAG: hypothetical protein CM15mP32_4160 [Flavobacteriaceae bacterium]|nr:MAG: hypothetical protein CM15mP32_4160 [Flavobacteriaceae bacterium]